MVADLVGHSEFEIDQRMSQYGVFFNRNWFEIDFKRFDFLQPVFPMQMDKFLLYTRLECRIATISYTYLQWHSQDFWSGCQTHKFLPEISKKIPDLTLGVLNKSNSLTIFEDDFQNSRWSKSPKGGKNCNI